MQAVKTQYEGSGKYRVAVKTTDDGRRWRECLGPELDPAKLSPERLVWFGKGDPKPVSDYAGYLIAGHPFLHGWCMLGMPVYLEEVKPQEPPAPVRRSIEGKRVTEYGVTLDGVWLPYDLLERLNDQGQWDSQQGTAFIDADRDQERVLVARGLAERETRGGLHRGEHLRKFLDSIEWPRGEKQ